MLNGLRTAHFQYGGVEQLFTLFRLLHYTVVFYSQAGHASARPSYCSHALRLLSWECSSWTLESCRLDSFLNPFSLWLSLSAVHALHSSVCTFVARPPGGVCGGGRWGGSSSPSTSMALVCLFFLRSARRVQRRHAVQDDDDDDSALARCSKDRHTLMHVVRVPSCSGVLRLPRARRPSKSAINYFTVSGILIVTEKVKKTVLFKKTNENFLMTSLIFSVVRMRWADDVVCNGVSRRRLAHVNDRARFWFGFYNILFIYLFADNNNHAVAHNNS